MAIVTFEEDPYQHKHLLRFVGEDFVGALHRIGSAIEGLTAELAEINRRDGLSPEAREKLSELINLMGESEK